MKKKKPEIQKGQFWTIDNKLFRGHKGRISKKKKNGIYEAVCITHQPKTSGKSNSRLIKNPDPASTKDSYVMRRPMEAKTVHLGTYHPNMKVTNNRDKALFRNIAKRKPKKLQ